MYRAVTHRLKFLEVLCEFMINNVDFNSTHIFTSNSVIYEENIYFFDGKKNVL